MVSCVSSKRHISTLPTGQTCLNDLLNALEQAAARSRAEALAIPQPCLLELLQLPCMLCVGAAHSAAVVLQPSMPFTSWSHVLHPEQLLSPPVEHHYHLAPDSWLRMWKASYQGRKCYSALNFLVAVLLSLWWSVVAVMEAFWITLKFAFYKIRVLLVRIFKSHFIVNLTDLGQKLVAQGLCLTNFNQFPMQNTCLLPISINLVFG